MIGSSNKGCILTLFETLYYNHLEFMTHLTQIICQLVRLFVSPIVVANYIPICYSNITYIIYIYRFPLYYPNNPNISYYSHYILPISITTWSFQQLHDLTLLVASKSSCPCCIQDERRPHSACEPIPGAFL